MKFTEGFLVTLLLELFGTGAGEGGTDPSAFVLRILLTRRFVNLRRADGDSLAAFLVSLGRLRAAGPFFLDTLWVDGWESVGNWKALFSTSASVSATPVDLEKKEGSDLVEVSWGLELDAAVSLNFGLVSSPSVWAGFKSMLMAERNDFLLAMFGLFSWRG